MKRLVIILYEVFMISLVIFSLVYTWLGIGGAGKLFVKIMWMIFLVDVVARFVATKGKWKYLKENPFDVVSVIPLEDSLLLARFARLIKLFRLKTALKRDINPFIEYMKNISLKNITLVCIGINIVGSILVYSKTDWGITKTFIWVVSNFIKFNYIEGMNDNYILAVALCVKITGVVYVGSIIKELLQFLNEKLRGRLKKQDKQKTYNINEKERLENKG